MNRIVGGLCSTSTLKALAGETVAPYVVLQIDSRAEIKQSASQIERMAQVAQDTGAAIVYSDYFEEKSPDAPLYHPLTDYQPGSVRNDFDFGALAMVPTLLLRQCLSPLPEYEHAAWYALRLALSRAGAVVRIPEPLYSACSNTDAESQFDYVDPRNREVQIEMEQAFTHHLKEIGAFIDAPLPPVSHDGDFPVEASVVIPVRNRERTIEQAVRSALNQEAPFEFNVIVVDNHSTDATTEILRDLAKSQHRLIHIIPEETSLGIGGCWNKAITDARCGRFAIQLDSDDLYSSADVLKRMVNCFRSQGAAMVIGSYALTDFDLQPIPPGVIDHREWTDSNGPNNALRINGLGAPRAFFTPIARRLRFPDVSYGEDYAMALRISRSYRIGRIFDVLYLCRRWTGNSDASLSLETANRYNHYKDSIRTWEIHARQKTDRHD